VLSSKANPVAILSANFSGAYAQMSTSLLRQGEMTSRVRYFSCMIQTPSHASSGGLA
jgi:hypothetical protein